MTIGSRQLGTETRATHPTPAPHPHSAHRRKSSSRSTLYSHTTGAVVPVVPMRIFVYREKETWWYAIMPSDLSLFVYHHKALKKLLKSRQRMVMLSITYLTSIHTYSQCTHSARSYLGPDLLTHPACQKCHRAFFNFVQSRPNPHPSSST